MIFKLEAYGQNGYFKYKQDILNVLTQKFGMTPEMANITYDNCMIGDYACVKPVSKDFPNGILMKTDSYRQTVVIE